MPTINGTASGETLVGTADADTISGLGGNDILTGGAGNDFLDGGDGIDTADYSVESASGRIFVNLGTSPLAAPGGVSLASNQVLDAFGNVDTLSSIERIITGNQSDFVIGSDRAETFETGGANDTLIGGGGADILIGGSGNDVYVASQLEGDTIVEAADGGTADELQTLDRVINLGNFANVEVLRGLSASGHDFTGNSLDNIITGQAGADTLRGEFGNDLLQGGAGSDVLLGGSGADVLEGGSGDDRAEGGDGIDVLLGGTGADTMLGGQGSDFYEVDNVGDVVFEQAGAGIADNVYAYVDFNLPDNVDNLVMVYGNQRFGTGNAGDNIIIGNGQSNVFEAGAGYDTITGGAGSDLFIIRPGFGVEVITDFQTGAGSEDAVLFSSSLFTSFSQVMANSAQVGADTWIGDGLGNTVVLVGVQQSSLHANDFAFI